MRQTWIRIALVVAVIAIGAVTFTLLDQPAPAVSATGSPAVPAPQVDEPVPAGSTSETAVFAGGCFWGVQGVYQHLKGVTEAESGYAGGDSATADYETVSTGSTGHAESVRITYDPTQVTYGQLLRVFFTVAHDPTELNRQGPDRGTQYRSAIFPQNDTQKRIAESYIDQLNKASAFSAPIATVVTPGAAFYPAEAYHQDYLNSNPTNAYIAINDIPKVNELKRVFPDEYRDQPVLVRS